MLQNLTASLKRFLNSDLQKIYRAGFRDGELALTKAGRFELLEILAETEPFKEALTSRAEEIIKEETKKD